MIWSGLSDRPGTQIAYVASHVELMWVCLPWDVSWFAMTAVTTVPCGYSFLFCNCTPYFQIKKKTLSLIHNFASFLELFLISYLILFFFKKNFTKLNYLYILLLIKKLSRIKFLNPNVTNYIYITQIYLYIYMLVIYTLSMIILF